MSINIARPTGQFDRQARRLREERHSRLVGLLRRVDCFNNHRLFGPIGNIPPAEAEANYYAAIDNIDMVA